MSILPIVDLLILMASGVMAAAVFLKAVYSTTLYRPTLLGMSPMDCAVASGILLLFALTLVARTWVKSRDPEIMAARRFLQAREVTARAQALKDPGGVGLGGELEES